MKDIITEVFKINQLNAGGSSKQVVKGRAQIFIFQNQWYIFKDFFNRIRIGVRIYAQKAFCKNISEDIGAFVALCVGQG